MENNSKVFIVVEGGIDSLSGFDFGKECFDKFAKSKYNLNKSIVVVIPADINRIGISFVQGFISDIAKEYGISNVTKHLSVESEKPALVKKFYDSIMVY